MELLDVTLGPPTIQQLIQNKLTLYRGVKGWFILNVCTVWGWWVRFVFRQVSIRRKRLRHPLNRRLFWPQKQPGSSVKSRHFLYFVCGKHNLGVESASYQYLSSVLHASPILSILIFGRLRSISTIHFLNRPTSWSSGRSLWLLIMRSRVRFPAIPWEFSLKGRIPAVTMVWVG